MTNQGTEMAISPARLTGETITIERLTPEVADAIGRNHNDVGCRVIVRRLNGHPTATHGSEWSYDTALEKVAHSHCRRGARYVVSGAPVAEESA